MSSLLRSVEDQGHWVAPYSLGPIAAKRYHYAMSSQAFTLCLAAGAGVILMIVANRVRVPSIALLLIGGVLLGPQVLGLIDPADLGSGLHLIVGLVVAVILFEGGLTLNIEGARRAPVVIIRLLTLGVLITWWGTALTIWLLFSVPFEVAVLCGSLVIVTGPTVVSPLLRRIGVNERIKHILYWEAVLIDVIGVFIAVLCLEWISPEEAHAGWGPIARFAYRCGVGLVIGLGAGLIMAQAVRRDLVPDEHLNIFVLAGALICFTGSESVLHESGILAVIVAGLAVGLTSSPKLKQLKQFKLELTELGIGTLFILLSATLRLEPFRAYGWTLVVALSVVLFVLRPISIMAATYGRGLPLRERIFLSWIAPRGIVAAFMASLFALELSASPQYAEYGVLLQVFTFGVIGSSVIIQGLTAPVLAGFLRVRESNRQTWLLVGEPVLTSSLAAALQESGVPAFVVSDREVPGDQVIVGDATSVEVVDDPRLSNVGAILIASSDLQLSHRIRQQWRKIVPPEAIHDWHSAGSPLGKLGPPAKLSATVESGDSRIVSVIATGAPSQFASHQRPMIVSRDMDASLADPRVPPAKGAHVVAMRNIVQPLGGVFTDALVIRGGHNTLAQVTKSLVDHAAQLDGTLDSSALLTSVQERERSMPTGVGGGIAIPHAYADGLNRPQVFMALVQEGTSDIGPDGAPIDLVFLVISPAKDSASHLQALAAIARLGGETEFIETLKAQETSEELAARLEERC